MKLPEKALHKQICDYLNYKKVIFNTDASGIKLTIGQATQMKKLRSSNGFPDIVIYESSNCFNALFLEVKKETPYKKDGTLKKNEHLEEQLQMQRELIKRGYYATFVWTLDMAIAIIENYLKK